MTHSSLPHASSPRAADPFPAAPYAGYGAWKGWRKLFSYTQEDAAYFKGETRGLPIQGCDVLEIGFGAGSFLAWARDQGAAAAGTEIIPSLVEAGQNHGFTMLPAQLDRAADGRAGPFDVIVAFDVFEHLSMAEIVRHLRACCVLLKPGGHLLLRFPNGQSPFGLAPQNGDATHRTALSRSVFEQLTQELPFEFVRYAPAFRVVSGGFRKSTIRRMRYMARNSIAALLNAVYAEKMIWDPVVVLVLRKAASTH